jgi:hypothetical protein
MDIRRRTYVKKILYLVMTALVAMLILVPMAGAQEQKEQTMMVEQTKMVEGDLPKSGGLPVGTILAPAAALLLGGGIVAYAVARRR